LRNLADFSTEIHFCHEKLEHVNAPIILTSFHNPVVMPLQMCAPNCPYDWVFYVTTHFLFQPWLCKTIFTLSNLTFMTNIYWALVEGLFLYSRISIAVFSTNTPYWLLYSLGWGKQRTLIEKIVFSLQFALLFLAIRGHGGFSQFNGSIDRS